MRHAVQFLLQHCITHVALSLCARLLPGPIASCAEFPVSGNRLRADQPVWCDSLRLHAAQARLIPCSFYTSGQQLYSGIETLWLQHDPDYENYIRWGGINEVQCWDRRALC